MNDQLVFYSEVDPFDRWQKALQPLLGDVEMIPAAEVTEPERVKFTLAWMPPDGFFERFSSLELVLNLGFGVDRLVARDDLPDLPVVRLVDPSMAQMMTSFVLFSVLRHARDIPHFEAAQKRHEWAYVHPRHAAETTVVVLGLGELGTLAAAEIARHGFDTHGWATRPREIPGVTVHTGEDALQELLGKADILVLLLPLTAQTEGLIDARALARMPAGAALINVARGRIVDEGALVEAIRSGHLSGATLDVFQHEPLPANSPLWDLPGVLITPHLASVGIPETAADQIAYNIRAIREGLPLRNQVSLARGY